MQALSPLLRHLGVQPSPLVENVLSMWDMTRLKRAKEKEEEVVKRRRKSQRAQKKSVEERRVEEEGVTYASGGFRLRRF